ncbi:MAG: Fis family transcriptional regulator [Nitrospirae bacterium RBG_16_64_22]|nr:MAG: Fis family transcriptional regulator [Nitrospirae bacterium RBG_16_64_22]
MARLLVVDDEESQRTLMEITLRKEGYQVDTAADGGQALELIRTVPYDVVLTDIKMPRADGIEVLKTAKEVSPETVVIMITAYASHETAVEAMKLGAKDYIPKPFKVVEIKAKIRSALEERALRAENRVLRQEISQRAGSRDFVGKSPGMQKIFELIEKVAEGRSTVLISGESGTGKELVARAIHAGSGRKDRPFVGINCGAVPENLLESELFGHMKGSFTGAVANKDGLFEVADGGTLFLDEIAEMPLTLQVKILRAIQTREITPVGGTVPKVVDVRIIAATNRDLEAEVAGGRFREDLFYRLNVIPIHLPPLRERADDIPLLANHFLARYSREYRKKIERFSDSAMERLAGAKWRGNVRELENLIERAVALCDGALITTERLADLMPADRPSSMDQLPLGQAGFAACDVPDEGVDLDGLIEKTEKEFLLAALKKANGSKTEAARLLKMTFRSFRHRLQKYHLRGAVEGD